MSRQMEEKIAELKVVPVVVVPVNGTVTVPL